MSCNDVWMAIGCCDVEDDDVIMTTMINIMIMLMM